MTHSVERFSSVGLSLAALAIAATFAHREFRAHTPAPPAAAGPPTYVPDWQNLIPAGRTIGDPAAPIKVIEFGDFECPFCRKADSIYRGVAQIEGQRISLVFVHFPLAIHRFAMGAAQASECAASQQRFGQFHDLIYEKQDSLGLKTWASFANDAGIVDTAEFNRCVGKHTESSQIQAGLAAGKRLGVRGTPTILVNGWRFPAPPNERQLDSVIKVLATAGRPTAK